MATWHVVLGKHSKYRSGHSGKMISDQLVMSALTQGVDIVVWISHMCHA